MVTPTFERARVSDLDAIRAMLSASNLPIDDVDAHITEFVLARWEGAPVGTVAIEPVGEAGLLRSLCVIPSHRGHAIGTRLLAAIEATAAVRGVRVLYLLTTSAAAFFERHGFSETPRAGAPDGIRGTAQFRTLCPATAVCMRKTLASSHERTGSP